MVARKILRVCAASLIGLAFVTGTGVSASAAPAPEQSTQQSVNVRTLRYDTSRAAEFKEAWDEGAKIWNEHVKNVQLVPGTPAEITILADNGWPRAQVQSLGRGTVWMGRQATQQGHYVIRIASHELGHILGLPDRRTGRCDDLMSGASAGTACKNPNPNPAEIAEVERNFQFGRSGVKPGTVLSEAPVLTRH
ncbi:snapalysin family zinc-dependent metalloprotease [Actinomadura spongiicola]|uniref:Extracellular small neutral protease n=1 Tax=Actinomadura spongiicola TaxID=2303421 RepID=A0A372GCI8_9ACTN|nr:snapalysin family zinc-dependent metalloprotease [Actinomadura spongiicola]RFS83095.1 snapalysin family zinc-dependent metalloprotease [Actinomadura spongiicola]